MRHKKLVINLLEHGILHGRKQNTSYRVCFCLLGRENVNIRLFFARLSWRHGIIGITNCVKIKLNFELWYWNIRRNK